MEAWKRKKGFLRGARYEAVFSPTELKALGDVSALVSNALMGYARTVHHDPELEQLTGMSGGHDSEPQDAGLLRLFPNVQTEEDEEFPGSNGLWRSMNEIDICREKLKALVFINQVLAENPDGRITLEDNEAALMLRGLTDLRLYLGSHGELGQYTEVEGWIAFVQDSLLEAMMGE